MPQDPEAIEAMLQKIRRTREAYGAHAEGLREIGLEVDGFLADCDEFIALLEGRHEGEFDGEAFLRRLKEFSQEADEFIHLQEQVKAAELAGNLDDLLPMTERMIGELRSHGGGAEMRAAAEIEGSLAKFRAGLEDGRLDREAFQDMQLAMAVQLAEVDRRILFRTVATHLYWESWPPERWAKLSPEERTKVEVALAKWRPEKEDQLGRLPLEDRRRLEAMRYEDFDDPGALEP